jgi:hypothetical protein
MNGAGIQTTNSPRKLDNSLYIPPLNCIEYMLINKLNLYIFEYIYESLLNNYKPKSSSEDGTRSSRSKSKARCSFCKHSNWWKRLVIPVV